MLIVHVHVATCVRFSIINHSHNIIIAMYCGYSVAQELHLLQKLPQRFIGLFNASVSLVSVSSVLLVFPPLSLLPTPAVV